MNAAEDSVLEHALGELLGEGEMVLAERVLQRLREDEARGESQAAPVPTATGRRLAWLAAAALLVGAIWFLDPFGGGAPPMRHNVLATANAPFEVLHPGHPEPRMQAEFAPGETLVNGPGSERSLSLASGATVRMGRCSMLTLESGASGVVLDPKVGTVTVSAASGPALRIRTDLGTVTLIAPGTLRVERRAEGYTLERPERFRQLAQEIHMKSTLPIVVTFVALLEGSAVLETAAGPRALVAGESLQDPEAAVPAADVEARLLDEVGTWDLVVTPIGLDEARGEPLEGVEICRAGPGNKWLLTEQRVKRGDRELSVFTVVGYEARKRRYTGSLVDSFGGEIGLLKGTPDPELESRTLQMYSAEGTPGFDARMTMRWENENERRTEIEALIDEEWILIREIVHRRRE